MGLNYDLGDKSLQIFDLRPTIWRRFKEEAPSRIFYGYTPSKLHLVSDREYFVSNVSEIRLSSDSGDFVRQ